jgi:phosphoenolpyruvate-protein phosphotransferase
MQTITGIPASRGIALGPAFQFLRPHLVVTRYNVQDYMAEWARFESALDGARQQLAAVQASVAGSHGAEEAAIFEAQAMMLDDPDLIEAVRLAIQQEGINAEAALHDAAEGYAQALATLDDEYLQARAADVRDVANRVLRVLLNVAESPTAGLKAPSIILAADLAPSDTVMLDKSLVLGFCTAAGGATSHTAILARGLGLPAVVGVRTEILGLPDSAPLILDGEAGWLVVEPDAATTAAYRAKQAGADAAEAVARASAHEPAITRDGRRVEVVANIGNVAGAHAALAAGAEGVGLLRTEFLFLERTNLPSEEEQYRAYKAIGDAFGELPVVLRTLDVGGDKELPYLNTPSEQNPFLGVRAIRLCLSRPELFKPQLRAALRAGAGNGLKLMFPMVATVGEVRQARAVLAECLAELQAQGLPVAERMEVGIMIEIPAAAIVADQLAKVVDFFSIGTNDLSQYTMAADRTNAGVASLANAFQPAVLRLIRQVIDAAHAAGKWVGLCGELAGEPLAIPILLGLGLDEFSMNAPAIPTAKQVIRTLRVDEARAIAAVVLELESAEDVRNMVRARMPSMGIA